MKVLSKTKKEDFLKKYLEENKSKGPDYFYVKGILKGKKISLIKLTIEEIKEIIMPYHYFCEYSSSIFPLKKINFSNFGGKALKFICLKVDQKYEKKYTGCFYKINIQKELIKKKGLRTVIHSRGKPNNSMLSFIFNKDDKDKLYLVDGFHRLVALMMLESREKSYEFYLVE